MSGKRKYPQWFDGNKVNEILFCENFRKEHPMVCIKGNFFSVDGLIEDEAELETEIFDAIKFFVTEKVSLTVKHLLEVLRLMCHAAPLPQQTDRIHVANGTYFLDGRYTYKKEFCLNRLKVAYNEDAPKPERFLSFLNALLHPEDIPTLQEYPGYCLIPTNKAQKMMIITGNGGEGKSRLGLVMRSILGDNMNSGSIQNIERNRFARANLEYKLLMVDDDMKLQALPETSYIKTMVTLEGKMDVEWKGKQSEQRVMYCRFLCFGNGPLTALYDRSYGFHRRQLILTTKDRPMDRLDDPFLSEKLEKEAEGIFLWMLEGLNRLIANNYEFTVSERTQQNTLEAMEDSNNIAQFMDSTGYIRLEEGTASRSVDLYTAYKRWCKDNLEHPLSAKSFSQFLLQNQGKYGIRYSKHVLDNHRGFHNILVLIDPKKPGALDGAFFEEQQDHAPYLPFLP
jgi:putative DNA primase/helicase